MENNMGKPRKEISEAQRRRIVEDYREGYGFHHLAALYGHCDEVIRRVLVEAGVTLRPVGRPAKK
jgi:hypothetical protein